MAKKTYLVEMDRSGIEEHEKIMPVLRKFAQKIKANIVVANPHSDPRPPYRGEEFGLSILFWSLPERVPAATYPQVYGYELGGGQHDGFGLPEKMDPSWVAIVDPQGTTIAVVVGKTLYILFDLPHTRGTRPNIILDLILADYFIYRTNIEAFKKEMKRRVRGIKQSRFLNAYKMALSGSTSRSIERIEERINEQRQQLAEFVRDRKIILERKRNLVEGQDNDLKVKEMFRNLRKLSRNVTVTQEGTVVIPLGQIDIEYRGEVYDIGRFDLEINLVSCKLRCFNRTRDVGINHPHVNSSGSCCLGDASYGISVLLGDLELEAVVIMMIEFLKSYDANGSYMSIDKWPKRSKK